MNEDLTIQLAVMDPTVPIDAKLRALGYAGRTYLGDHSKNTFFHILGMCHINYYITSAANPRIPLSLRPHFPEAELASANSQISQLLDWIAAGNINTETLSNTVNLQYYVEPYCTIGMLYCDAQGTITDEVVQKMCAGLGVHIVIMSHAGDTVVCCPFTVEETAPILHMETFANVFCALVLENTEGFPKQGTNNEIMAVYADYIARPPAPVLPAQPAADLNADMMQLVEDQRLALAALVQTIRNPVNSIEAVAALERVRQQASRLGADPAFYDSLKRELAASKPQAAAVGALPPPNVLSPPRRVDALVQGFSRRDVHNPAANTLSALHIEEEDSQEVPRKVGKLPSPRNRAQARGQLPLHVPSPPTPMSKKLCSHCRRLDRQMYDDGPSHLYCGICMHCAGLFTHCPVCKAKYSEPEVARFNIMKSKK